MGMNLRSSGVPTRTEEQIYKDSIKLLDLSLLYVKENIRKEYNELEDLKESIKTEGLLQPITVIKDDDGMFYVLVGHRRFMAYKSLNEENPGKFMKIPAIVKYSIDEIKRLEIQIIENEQRNNFKPIELAIALKELKEKTGRSNKEIAKSLGKGEKWVRDNLTAVEIAENIIKDEKSISNEIVVNDDLYKEVAEKFSDLPITSIVETKSLPTDMQSEILEAKDLTQKEIREVVSNIKKLPNENVNVKKEIKKIKDNFTSKKSNNNKIVVNDDQEKASVNILIENKKEALPKRKIKNINNVYKAIEKISIDEDIKDIIRRIVDSINE